jgi:hypothetical protein
LGKENTVYRNLDRNDLNLHHISGHNYHSTPYEHWDLLAAGVVVAAFAVVDYKPLLAVEMNSYYLPFPSQVQHPTDHYHHLINY